MHSKLCQKIAKDLQIPSSRSGIELVHKQIKEELQTHEPMNDYMASLEAWRCLFYKVMDDFELEDIHVVD